MVLCKNVDVSLLIATHPLIQNLTLVFLPAALPGNWPEACHLDTAVTPKFQYEKKQGSKTSPQVRCLSWLYRDHVRVHDIFLDRTQTECYWSKLPRRFVSHFISKLQGPIIKQTLPEKRMFLAPRKP